MDRLKMLNKLDAAINVLMDFSNEWDKLDELDYCKLESVYPFETDFHSLIADFIQFKNDITVL